MYCSNHPYALIKLQILSRNKNFTKFLEVKYIINGMIIYIKIYVEIKRILKLII